MLTNLWIRNKYSGEVHKIGSDPHDCLMVDEEGTIHYYNLQCGDGCIGYKSVNKTTLSEEFPDTDWDKRKDEFCYGYEFVPNMNEYGYPIDPTKEEGYT